MSHPPSDPYGLGLSRPEDYDALRLEVIRKRWDQKADRWDADLADEHFHLNEDDAYHRFLDAADAAVAQRGGVLPRPMRLSIWPAARDWCWRISSTALPAASASISARKCWPWLPGAACRTCGWSRRVVSSWQSTWPARCRALAGILLSHYGPRWMPLLLEQVRRSLTVRGRLRRSSISSTRRPAASTRATRRTRPIFIRKRSSGGAAGRFPPRACELAWYWSQLVVRKVVTISRS